MKLTQNQQEKLTLAIQGFLGVIIIGMTAMNTAKAESVHAKKLSKKNAREIGKLQKQEYKLKARLMKQQYAGKIAQAKKRQKFGKG